MLRTNRRTARLFLESLEDRCNPSLPAFLGNVNLVGADSPWVFTGAPLNASPVLFDLDGDGQQEVIAPGGDGNLYAYKFNKAANQLQEERQFFCGTAVGQIEATPVVAVVKI